MAQITRVTRNQSQKDIIKAFDNLQGKHNMHQLWSDFVVMMACTISNAVDAAHRDDREKTYLSIASQYTEKELNAFAEIFAIIVEAYEANSNQDLLGELFMGLGLGNDSGGQFFTPYDVCRCTAELTFGDTAERIKDKGWVSVNDPAVGAGALLIAFANICEIKHINYQQHVLFVAQEIDFTTACMCYIQLSLLGCPGYVYVGNTITDPCTSIDGNALTPAKPEKCWFTPMYFHQTYAASTNSGRPVFTGVFLDGDGENLNVVACDGYRCAWAHTAYAGEIQMIIPKPTVKLLLSIRGKEKVSIQTAGEKAIFRIGDCEIYARLLSGTFMDYRKIFPTREHSIGVDRKSLMDAMNRIMICSDEAHKGKVEIDGTGATLQLKSSGTKVEYIEELEAKEPIATNLRIMFNSAFLQDALKSYDCSTIDCFFGVKNVEPLILDDGQLRSLILPVRMA